MVVLSSVPMDGDTRGTRRGHRAQRRFAGDGESTAV
jgi:hypothetical protein